MYNSSRTPSRTAYRSFRYSLNRQQNVRTADASSVPKFRIKKNSVLDSTMMKTNGFQFMNKSNPVQQMSKTISTNNDPQQTNYLKKFFSAIDCQKKSTYQQRQQWRVKPLRFKIQNFQQLETSDFTLLDPIKLHIKAINTQCKIVQQQLKRQRLQVNLIRGQIQNINKKINIQLIQTQKSSVNYLQRFSGLLKQNSIKQQQIKLRFKQDIAQLQIQHQQNINKCTKILDQNISLQQTIFNCQPYQLKESQQWNEFSNTNITIGIKDGTSC